MKKFELTQEAITVMGKKLYRILALIRFGTVFKGELGGYVEAEKNLSQSGDAWVFGNARVFGNAQVSGDARVFGDARVSGDAWVFGTCINIRGRWNITITDNHISIGCELHTIAQWFKFKDIRISKMAPDALEWWERNKEWLKLLCVTRGQ